MTLDQMINALVTVTLVEMMVAIGLGVPAADLHAGRIVVPLLATQLIPLAVGLGVRRWRPRLAEVLQGPANLISKVLNLAVVGCILATQFHLLLAIRPLAFVGMLALLIASWEAG